MNFEIFKYGYNLTDFPNNKGKTYVNCDIHGITPCTYKLGVCDRCYLKERYTNIKSRSKKMKYCLFHGLQETDSSGRCKICEKYKRELRKIL